MGKGLLFLLNFMREKSYVNLEVFTCELPFKVARRVFKILDSLGN